MKLEIKNVGKVKDADIDIVGIAVIAGFNDTGKSTVGKSLYSVFNGFYDLDAKAKHNQIDRIEQLIAQYYDDEYDLFFSHRFDDVARYIYAYDDFKTDKKLLNDFLKDKLKIKNKREFDLSEKIFDIINIDKKEIYKTVLRQNLLNEFSGQINNIYNKKDAEINLTIKNKVMSVIVRNDDIVELSNYMPLVHEAIYIDNPFVLDELYSRNRFSNMRTHNGALLTKLRSMKYSNADSDSAITEILANKKLDEIFNLLNNVCDGDITESARMYRGFKSKGSSKILNISNLSAGLKTFVIIKSLLLTGAIKENGTLILDEPEIHLHPEWQIIFAEIIVLLQKIFSMHILVNSHSPYFIEAIEKFSKHYDIEDKCKFYYAKNTYTRQSEIKDVTEKIEEIFSIMLAPFQKLENIANED